MPDGPTDDEIAAMAAAALVAVRKQRNTTHDTAAAALAAVLAALAAGINVMSVVDVIDPDATHNTRKAAVAAELARQARILGIDLTWQTVVRDAHTAATLAGAAAAAHVVSAGNLPVDPEPSPFPNPFDPRPWIEVQQAGLAADVVAFLTRAENTAAGDALANPPTPGVLDIDLLGVTPDDLLTLIDAGAGALYYLDQQIADTYLAASTAVYLDLGLINLYWTTFGDSRVCGACLALEGGSPYTAAGVPGVPHGGCRCFVTPG